MRLKNKKTGEIHEITEVVPLHDMDKKFVIYSKTEGHNHAYKNLAELNEEWEDAPEEPSEIYFISNNGQIHEEDGHDRYREKRKEIGNYFSSREEAELAVEKLKAWKRLKDKGFRFNRWTIPEEPKTPHIKLVIEAEMDVPDSPYDLDIFSEVKND